VWRERIKRQERKKEGEKEGRQGMRKSAGLNCIQEFPEFIKVNLLRFLFPFALHIFGIPVQCFVYLFLLCATKLHEEQVQAKNLQYPRTKVLSNDNIYTVIFFGNYFDFDKCEFYDFFLA
jgi:hypothetical protein